MYREVGSDGSRGAVSSGGAHGRLLEEKGRKRGVGDAPVQRWEVVRTGREPRSRWSHSTRSRPQPIQPRRLPRSGCPTVT